MLKNMSIFWSHFWPRGCIFGVIPNIYPYLASQSLIVSRLTSSKKCDWLDRVELSKAKILNPGICNAIKQGLVYSTIVWFKATYHLSTGNKNSEI